VTITIVQKVVRVAITPQFGGDQTFAIDIYERDADAPANEEEKIAGFSDISGLGGVYAQLGTWAETFAAGGGNIIWIFEGGNESLRFEFQSGTATP
jgi:hypothetical protein